MKITFLGTGSAFAVQNYNTSFLLETHQENKMLFDAGGDLRHALHAAGCTHRDACEAIFISHIHGDHMGGLEYLAFISHFDPDVTHKPYLYAHKDDLEKIWKMISPSVSRLTNKLLSLDDYFDVMELHSSTRFFPTGHHIGCEPDGFACEMIPLIHFYDGSENFISHGLFLQEEGPEMDPIGDPILITGDCQFGSNQKTLMPYYREAGFIIHDCETYPGKSGAHAHYDELSTLPPEIKGKMILTHFQDNVMDDPSGWSRKAKQDGFLGFAFPGMVWENGKWK